MLKFYMNKVIEKLKFWNLIFKEFLHNNNYAKCCN